MPLSWEARFWESIDALVASMLVKCFFEVYLRIDVYVFVWAWVLCDAVVVGDVENGRKGKNYDCRPDPSNIYSSQSSPTPCHRRTALRSLRASPSTSIIDPQPTDLRTLNARRSRTTSKGETRGNAETLYKRSALPKQNLWNLTL